MIYAIISLALLSACFNAVQARESLMTRFANWAHEHNIDVPEDDHLFLHMYENWVANDKLIDETNAKNLSYTLGHNVYSGMSLAEFAEHMHFGMNRAYLGVSEATVSEATVGEATVGEDTNFLRGALPTSVDWRTKGAVSPIGNQLNYGNCYSFSTSCAVESAHAIKTGNLVKLSEQQIVDCSTMKNGGPNHGNSGGVISPTFTWIGKVGGLCTENAYPYVGQSGTCQTTCSKVAGTAPSSVVNVKANSDADMMTAIATTVVSIAVQANQASFQLYKSGIFTGTCTVDLDHAVNLIGYGSDYYILRNSWGTTWGESGYMRIGKGNDPATGKPYNGGAGQCGLLMQGSYPVL